MSDAEWRVVDDDGFIGHVGPLLTRQEGERPAFAIDTRPHHRNLRDVVQGGLIMTLADRAMGSTVRAVADSGPIATVQLDVHFLAPARIGERLEARATVTRNTREIVFVEASLTADGRPVATAKGIWKRLRPA